MVRAAGDEVPGKQGRDGGAPLHGMRDVVPHVIGVVVLPRLPIDPQLDRQVLGLFDLIGGHQERAHWRKGVPRLPPEEARLVQPPCRDIDKVHVPEDVVVGVCRLHARGLFPDNQGHLCLVVEDVRLVGRKHHRIPVSNHGVRRLEKGVKGPGLLEGPVLQVVGRHAHHVDRLWQRCPQAHLVHRCSAGAVGGLLQPGPVLLEVPNKPANPVLERHVRNVPDDVRHIHHAVVLEYPGDEIVEKAELHTVLLLIKGKAAALRRASGPCRLLGLLFSPSQTRPLPFQSVFDVDPDPAQSLHLHFHHVSILQG